MALLSVENLAIEVKRGAESYPLVRRASWRVDAGETLAVVGESGSGKSLTALAVMGLLPEELSVTKGRVMFDGRDLTSLKSDEIRQIRGREIAMVFQEPMTSLNPVKSIGSQITEGLRLNLGYSRADAFDRAIDLLDEVGISDGAQRLKQFPHQLSGGMRQRVMIAIALACKPRLILADEPTTALDVTIQAQILSLTSRLCREHGVGLVLITHNLGIVARHAKRVVVMYGGQVVEEALAGDLYRDPRHPYTRGLLRSIPRLDLPRDAELQPIEGAPPDPFDQISGCRFAPRCADVSPQCTREDPPLVADGTRTVACWNSCAGGAALKAVGE